jgi:hypothetical protein
MAVDESAHSPTSVGGLWIACRLATASCACPQYVTLKNKGSLNEAVAKQKFGINISVELSCVALL